MIAHAEPTTAPELASEPTPAPAPAVPALLLSREQTAAALGGLSDRGLSRLERSGVLGPRPVKLGGRVLYDPRQLEAWIAAGCPRREIWEQLSDPHETDGKAGASLRLRGTG